MLERDHYLTGATVLRNLKRAELALSDFDEVTDDVVSPAMLKPLLLLMHDDTQRVSPLAAEAGITQQAMGKILQQMQSVGLVRIKSDPCDARARAVTITRKGKTLLRRYLDTCY